MKLVVVLVALLAAVSAKKGFGPGEQDWGYAEVRPGAHVFWWLYYSTATDVIAPEDKPLVIWLQGGPGASGTGFGNFEEIGPLDENLNPRDTTWVKDYNVLFIDNPVGTGFSYVDSSDLLTKTNKQIALDLVELMKQFYNQLPDFEETPLYILSESYGGKMTAEFAYELTKAIKAGQINSNLVGVGLGDSWISPVDSVLTWAPYLLALGAVDNDGYNQIMSVANRTRDAVNQGSWTQATNLWSSTEGVVMQVTDGIDFYNVLTKIGGGRRDYNKKHDVLPGAKIGQPRDSLYDIMNNQVKEALGLTSHWSDSSGSVFNTLAGDFMKPVTNVVEQLLNETNVKVFVYSGQLDLIVDTPGTYDWVMRLRWPGRSNWDATRRKSLIVKGIVEGYEKQYGNFGMFWVDRAGHMVPADNPAAMSEILSELTAR